MVTPILVLAYNRADKLSELLNLLFLNKGIDKHQIIIHIDGPNIYKGEKEKDKICQVLKAAKKYESLHSNVRVEIEKYHTGLAKSVIKSVGRILEKYGRIIVLEDDLVISDDCISFLDKALNYYKDNQLIWSVTAWSPPIEKLNSYEKDVYFSYRGSSYAWGTWKDRWDDIDWNVSDYSDFMHNYREQLKFCRGGYDLPSMLRKQMCYGIDSWAVRWCYAQYKRDMLTVYPRESMVEHIADKDATHVFSNFPQQKISKRKNEISFSCELDKKLSKEFANYFGWNYKKWLDDYHANSLRADKFERMYNVSNMMLGLVEKEQEVSSYFTNRKIKSVAIYGKGIIGQKFKETLDKEGRLKKVFFIDRNPKLRDGVNCFSYKDDIECDAIVVSVMGESSSLVYELEQRYPCKIKTIFDVLRDQ